jgi:hypothetical protein
VIREIELLVDVGVRHFPLAFDSVAELRRFVDEVVPHLRMQPVRRGPERANEQS